jgi:hypothetical protein
MISFSIYHLRFFILHKDEKPVPNLSEAEGEGSSFLGTI